MRASAAEAALKVAKEGVAAAEAAVPARLAGRPATLARLLLGDAEGGADGGMWAVAASEFAKKQNCSPEGSMDVKAQFAAMRQRQGILQASAGLCGPTETISEVGEDDTTLQSRQESAADK